MRSKKKYYAQDSKGRWVSIYAYSPEQASKKCEIVTSMNHVLFQYPLVIKSEFWLGKKPERVPSYAITHIHKADLKEEQHMIKNKINDLIDEEYQLQSGQYAGWFIVGVQTIGTNMNSAIVYLSRNSIYQLEDVENKDIIFGHIQNLSKLFSKEL